MIFDNNSLNALRHEVGSRLSQKRYDHTIGVEKMATHIGNIILPDKIYELKVAALLHDIAKEISQDDQLRLLLKSDILTDVDLSTKPALHSFAAVLVIKRDFPQYATNDVLSAVFNHTLGAPGMSVFDEIIFISDFAEDGRTYPACKEVNNFIKTNISCDKSNSENIILLHRASLIAIDSTIDSINNRGERINALTILTRDYLDEKIKKYEYYF